MTRPLRLTARGALLLLAVVLVGLVAAGIVGQHRQQTWCEQHPCSTVSAPRPDGVAWKHLEAGVAWKALTP